MATPTGIVQADASSSDMFTRRNVAPAPVEHEMQLVAMNLPQKQKRMKRRKATTASPASTHDHDRRRYCPASASSCRRAQLRLARRSSVAMLAVDAFAQWRQRMPLQDRRSHSSCAARARIGDVDAVRALNVLELELVRPRDNAAARAADR